MIFWKYFKNIDVPTMIAMQENHLQQKKEGGQHQYIFYAEHPHCITYRYPEDLDGHRIDPTKFAELVKKTPTYQYTRGGGLICHGPGQLTAYCVFDELGMYPTELSQEILSALQRVLRRNFGLVTHTPKELLRLGREFPFVADFIYGLMQQTTPNDVAHLWVIQKERRRVKMIAGITGLMNTDGFLLHLHNDLTWYNEIIKPYGFDDVETTSVKTETSVTEFDFAEIAEDITEEIGDLVGEGVAHYSSREMIR